MYNTKYILGGLAVFLIIAALPFWYNIATGSAAELPVIEPHATGEACVLEAAEMRANHMQLLDEWRDAVVREGHRTFVTGDGREFVMSLSNGCLDCHTSKAQFCDVCHGYSGVEPNCFDCHVDPASMAGAGEDAQ